MKSIDPELASKLLDLIPKSYFANCHDYGGGWKGYHVGWLGTVCVHVNRENVPSWEDITFDQLMELLKESIDKANLPVTPSPDPELVGRNWQVYFSLI